ncbi:unnamed protein product [Allacma fusca]|uniref:Integrase zinc-binding domain-containing protein n=1 Tax=Allacma fusca TaxID=39272 RepID=A0A8J2P5U4_9HEXA|nr:unnamed protein product [Allacma fusca]
MVQWTAISKLGQLGWPKEPLMNDVILPEEEIKKAVLCMVVTGETFKFQDVERFSSWLKLVRTTAWCKRFLVNFKNKFTGLIFVRGELMVDEIERAEQHWWRAVQRECFGEEMSLLLRNNAVHKNSKLFSLNPFLDNTGVMRVTGRTERSSALEEATKFPIILDPSHGFTKFLMRYYHEQGGHHGLETVICNLRLKYWILHMRASMKKVFMECQRCKIRKAMPSTYGYITRRTSPATGLSVCV